MGTGEITRFPHHNSLGGFTLIETMTTLAVASVLLTAAVPPMQDFVTRNRMSTEVNTFIASLYLARSEAVKRMQNVQICPANSDFTACVISEDWEDGWMVYADLDQNGDFDPDVDTILQQNPGLPDRFKITGNQQSFAYDATGKLLALTNGHYDFCDTGDVAQGRRVTVSPEGRVRVNQLTTADCS